MKKLLFLLLLAFSFVAVFASPSDKKLFDEILASSSSVNVQAYPDADLVLLYDYDKIVYQADGRCLETDEVFEKILTEKGRRETMSMSFNYMLPYYTVKVTTLEVIKADGRIVPVDIEKNSKEMVDRSQMDANIFNPNDKILTVSVPGLEIGDILHYVIIKDQVKTIMPDTWSDYYVLESTTPILKSVIEVSAPNKLPLKNMKLRDEVKGTVNYEKQESGDRTIHRWTALNVPRFFEEPSMPPYYTVVQRLLVSTIPDWQTISKWYWNISEPHLAKTNPEMQKKVEELTANISDRNRKIEAIFRFVSQQIRYMGITTETVAPGYEPHDIDITFNNRYGVCRDKAALLVGMLRLAGIKAYPVLIHAGYKKDFEVPQPYFNHAIVAAEDEKGSYILMDPTDENTNDLLPGYLCNKSYLVARPEGETLKTSPVIPAEKNLVKIRTSGKMLDGTLKAESELIFDGVNDNAYRSYFSKLKAEEIRLFFEGKIKDAIPGSALKSCTVIPTDLSDMSMPLTVKISYETPDYPVSGKDLLLMPAPILGTSFGIVTFVLGETGLEKRRFPLDSEMTCGVYESFDIVLDKSFGKVISLPKYKKIDSAQLYWSQNVQDKNSSLSGDASFMIKTVEFSPSEYQALRTALKEIEYEERKMPVFAAVGTSNGNAALAELTQGADLLVLEDNTVYDLQSSSSWTMKRNVKKQVLSYAGKKKNSDLMINYNPAYETVTVSGSVSSKDGVVRKLEAQEINIMDAAWAASAPRYPASKTLVASFPGVENGSIIDYEIVSKVTGRPFFSATDVFRHFDPIASKQLTVNLPLNLNLEIVQTGDMKSFFSSSKNNQSVSYSWIRKNIKRIKPEDSLPPLWSFMPSVIVSSGNWTSLASDLNKRYVDAAAGDKEVKAFTAKLIADEKTELGKISLIKNYVASKIRKVQAGIFEIPYSSISSADKTFADTYGNSADKAVLLYAMLKAAGFSPEFVLSSPYADCREFFDILKKAPQLSAFDEVLVLVKSSSGSMIYLNDADQYACVGTAARAGKPGLFISRPDATLADVNVPETQVSSTSIEFKVKILENGDAEITRTDLYSGIPFADFHKRFAEMTPEKRDRYFQELVSSIAQSASPLSAFTTDYASYPGRQSFTVSVPRFAVKDGRFMYFRLPGEDIVKSVLRFRADKRDNPYYRSRDLVMDCSFKVELSPSAVDVKLMPSSVDWESVSGSAFLRSRISPVRTESDGRKIFDIRTEVRFRASIVSPAEYENLTQIYKTFSKPEMNLILFSIKAVDL